MRVVLANGCWDPPHYGHLLHLKAARAMGDQLVVSITIDEQVRREKGIGRPSLDQVQRKLFLESLRVVDWTLFVSSALEAVQIVKPAVFVKGIDYVDGVEDQVKAFCEERGIQIRFTSTPKWSATKVLDELRRR